MCYIIKYIQPSKGFRNLLRNMENLIIFLRAFTHLLLVEDINVNSLLDLQLLTIFSSLPVTPPSFSSRHPNESNLCLRGHKILSAPTGKPFTKAGDQMDATSRWIFLRCGRNNKIIIFDFQSWNFTDHFPQRARNSVEKPCEVSEMEARFAARIFCMMAKNWSNLLGRTIEGLFFSSVGREFPSPFPGPLVHLSYSSRNNCTNTSMEGTSKDTLFRPEKWKDPTSDSSLANG